MTKFSYSIFLTIGILSSILFFTLYSGNIQAKDNVRYLPEEIITTKFKYKYTYDEQNRKIKQEGSSIYKENLVLDHTFIYTYNEDGTIKTRIFTDYETQNNETEVEMAFRVIEYYQYQNLSDTLTIEYRTQIFQNKKRGESDTIQLICRNYINSEGLLYKQISVAEDEAKKEEETQYEYNSKKQLISQTIRRKKDNITYKEEAYKSLAVDNKNGIFKDVNINPEQPNFHDYINYTLLDNPTLVKSTTFTLTPFNPISNAALPSETISKTYGLYYVYNKGGYPTEIEIYELDDNGNKEILKDKLSIKYIKID